MQLLTINMLFSEPLKSTALFKLSVRRQASAAMNAVIHTAVFLDVLLDQRFKEKHFHNIIVRPTPETCMF